MTIPPSTITRRRFLRHTAAAIALTRITPALAAAAPAERPFRLWAMGDAHVGTDLPRKRESLAEAIRQSEQGGKDGAPPFDWDIALNHRGLG
mgnify:CR=1 FL=1